MAKKPEHMVRKGQRRPPSLGFLDSWAVYSLITTLFADLLKRRLQNEVLGYLRSWVVGLFECDKLIEKINIQSDVTKNAKEKKPCRVRGNLPLYETKNLHGMLLLVLVLALVKHQGGIAPVR